MPVEQLDLFAYTLTPDEVCTEPVAPKPPQSTADLSAVPPEHRCAIAHYQRQADYYLALICRFVKFGLPPEPDAQRSERCMRYDHPARKHEITRLSAMREQAIAKIKELSQ